MAARWPLFFYPEWCSPDIQAAELAGDHIALLELLLVITCVPATMFTNVRLRPSSVLLLFAAVPGCSALVMSHRPSLPGTATCRWQRAHEVRACADGVTRDSEDKLEQRFASELARRQAGGMTPVTGGEPKTSLDEPFRGIREVVLDPDGIPRAIPKREPPPPADTLEDNAASVRSLFSSPEFLFGTVLSLGSLILLLVIANADAGA